MCPVSGTELIAIYDLKGNHLASLSRKVGERIIVIWPDIYKYWQTRSNHVTVWMVADGKVEERERFVFQRQPSGISYAEPEIGRWATINQERKEAYIVDVKTDKAIRTIDSKSRQEYYRAYMICWDNVARITDLIDGSTVGEHKFHFNPTAVQITYDRMGVQFGDRVLVYDFSAGVLEEFRRLKEAQRQRHQATKRAKI